MAKMNWKKAKWENRIARYGKMFGQEPALSAIDPIRQPTTFSPKKHKSLVISQNQIVTTRTPAGPKPKNSTQKLVGCPSCRAQVAPRNLQKHQQKVHPDLIQTHTVRTKSTSEIAIRPSSSHLIDEQPAVESLPEDSTSAVIKLSEQIQQLLFGTLLDAPHDQRMIVELSALIRARQALLRKIHVFDEDEYTALVTILRTGMVTNADTL